MTGHGAQAHPASGVPARPDEPIARAVTERVQALIAEAEQAAEGTRAAADARADQRLLEADRESGRLVEEARREATELIAGGRRRVGLTARATHHAEAVAGELAAAKRTSAALEDALALLEEALARLSDANAPVGETDHGTAAGKALPAAGGDGVTEGPSRANAVEELLRSHLAEAPDVPGPPLPAEEAPPGRRFERSSGPGGARLVAAQMARAGSSRGEVAAHLKRTFDISTPHEILNEAFGEPDADRTAGGRPASA